MSSKHVIDTTPLECLLCFRIMTEPKRLKCTHNFCKNCLVKHSDYTGERKPIPRLLCRKITPLKKDSVSENGLETLQGHARHLSLSQWQLKKWTELPLIGRIPCNLSVTRDGKMVVGFGSGDGGVEVVSVEGSQKKLQGVSVQRVSVLPDGRYVIRDGDGHISLYSQTWERINVARFDGVDNYGGMDVDGCDHIYAGCGKAKTVRLYTPEGGAPVREIPCHGYKPSSVCTMNHSEMLVVSDHSSVRVVDGEGNVLYDVNKEGFGARVAVLHDDNILIGWWKGSRVSVDLYTNKLRLVGRVLAEYPVHCWVRDIGEFLTGEIALCDYSKLHIFRQRVPLPG